MNYQRTIGHMFPTSKLFVEEIYDTLVCWEDTPKPTDNEIITYYNSIKPNGLRKK